jgi:hypothetical protein
VSERQAPSQVGLSQRVESTSQRRTANAPPAKQGTGDVGSGTNEQQPKHIKVGCFRVDSRRPQVVCSRTRAPCYIEVESSSGTRGEVFVSLNQGEVGRPDAASNSALVCIWLCGLQEEHWLFSLFSVVSIRTGLEGLPHYLLSSHIDGITGRIAR